MHSKKQRNFLQQCTDVVSSVNYLHQTSTGGLQIHYSTSVKDMISFKCTQHNVEDMTESVALQG